MSPNVAGRLRDAQAHAVVLFSDPDGPVGVIRLHGPLVVTRGADGRIVVTGNPDPDTADELARLGVD